MTSSDNSSSFKNCAVEKQHLIQYASIQPKINYRKSKMVYSICFPRPIYIYKTVVFSIFPIEFVHIFRDGAFYSRLYGMGFPHC